MRVRSSIVVVALGAAYMLACGGGQTSLYRGNIHSSSYGYAAANAGVGAALYVAAGGCKISGCPTNTQCNLVTERCDPIKCGVTDCKGQEVCDEKLGHCVPIMIGGQAKASPSTNTPPVPTPITVNAGPNALP